MKERRRLGRGRRGEVAVFDIVLFVPLLLVALLFLNSAVTLPTSTVAINVEDSRYASQGMASLLGSTVPSTLTLFWQPPVWPVCWPAGCWYTGNAQDWTVENLILWDAYLVSCHVPPTGQAYLDQPGWMGSSINLAAKSTAMGVEATLGYTPSANTFNSYYLQFNGTAFGLTPGCGAAPSPMRAYEGLPQPATTTPVYSWSTLIGPSNQLPGESQVMVQFGFWEP